MPVHRKRDGSSAPYRGIVTIPLRRFANSIMRIIALDPGITTGYAIGDISEDGEMIVLTGENRWDHKSLYDFLESNHVDVIICESFEFRKKARQGLELYSRELIGVCNLYIQMHMPQNVKLHMQQPLKSSDTTYFNDNRLKIDHIFKEGKGHANDAARHLLTWYQFRSGFQYNKKGYRSAADL